MFLYIFFLINCFFMVSFSAIFMLYILCLLDNFNTALRSDTNRLFSFLPFQIPLISLPLYISFKLHFFQTLNSALNPLIYYANRSSRSRYSTQVNTAAGQLRPLRHHIYRGAAVGARGADVGVRGAAVGVRGAAASAISAYLHTSYLGAQLSASRKYSLLFIFLFWFYFLNLNQLKHIER